MRWVRYVRATVWCLCGTSRGEKLGLERRGIKDWYTWVSADSQTNRLSGAGLEAYVKLTFAEADIEQRQRLCPLIAVSFLPAAGKRGIMTTHDALVSNGAYGLSRLGWRRLAGLQRACCVVCSSAHVDGDGVAVPSDHGWLFLGKRSVREWPSVYHSSILVHLSCRVIRRAMEGQSLRRVTAITDWNVLVKKTAGGAVSQDSDAPSDGGRRVVFCSEGESSFLMERDSSKRMCVECWSHPEP